VIDAVLSTLLILSQSLGDGLPEVVEVTRDILIGIVAAEPVNLNEAPLRGIY
jgi:hypothetical protein